MNLLSAELADQRLGPRRLLLAIALIYFILIGGTDAGRYITAIAAINAVVAGVLVVGWVHRLPSYADLLDKLILVALVLYLGLCLVSDLPRYSFDAAMTAIGFCAAFSLLRLEARGPLCVPQLRRILATCGVLLAFTFVLLWGTVWLKWISITHTAPPLNLILPVGPYRHYHVVGMLIALLLPAVVSMVNRRWYGALAATGAAAGLAVIFMSGSRTVWLALLGSTLISFAPRLLLNWRRIAPFAIAAAVVLAGLTFTSFGQSILVRLLGSSTVALRGEIWSAALTRWATSPLVGTGPGTFGPSFTLSGYFDQFADVGRHADNAIVQLLLEAGGVGVVALTGIVSAFVWTLLKQRRSLSMPALVGVLVFALASFTDNPSDTPSLVIILLVWAAVLVPTSHEPPRPYHWRRSRLAAAGVGLALMAVVTVLPLLARVSFDQARTLAASADPSAAIDSLQSAGFLDPAFALYQRELGGYLASSGRTSEAVHHLRRAVELNPADATALRALAIEDLGWEPSRAIDAAQRAVALRPTHAENQLTLAYVAGKVGATDIRDQALTAAVHDAPWLVAAPSWSEFAPAVDIGRLSKQVALAWAISGESRPRFEDERVWAAAASGGTYPTESPPLLVIQQLLDCRIGQAQSTIASMAASDKSTITGLEAQILVARASGEIARAEAAKILALLRWPTLGRMAGGTIGPTSPFADDLEDFRLYGRTPLAPPQMDPRLPTAHEGMSAWLNDPVAAAKRGAPLSALATCR